MDIYNIVRSAYLKKLSDGINREAANSFSYTDFPGVPEEDLKQFGEDFGKLQPRGFHLSRDTMDEFEED